MAAAPENFRVRNHYVPQWYQRRFLEPGTPRYWYLDLKPDLLHRGGGRPPIPRRDLLNWGPAKCFCQDHLYTLNFGLNASDAIERSFFGRIDSLGEFAVKFFANYSMRDGVHRAFGGMCDYLAAQLFRTPKGLDMLRRHVGAASHRDTLIAMRALWRVFNTLWSEGVWEIVNCDRSRTKFITTDNPVTFFNPQIYPGSEEVRTYGMARMDRVGTRLIFPIDPNRCLVIAHLQCLRDPKGDPLRFRENARYFDQAVTDLRKVQRNREITESEVISINHVLKSHAKRYIAAGRKEWLYPELQEKLPPWPKLGGGGRFFLMPDPRKTHFSTGILIGLQGGGAWGRNEYGHAEMNNARAADLREREWRTFQSAKQAWDERDRRAGREPPADIREYLFG